MKKILFVVVFFFSINLFAKEKGILLQHLGSCFKKGSPVTYIKGAPDKAIKIDTTYRGLPDAKTAEKTFEEQKEKLFLQYCEPTNVVDSKNNNIITKCIGSMTGSVESGREPKGSYEVKLQYLNCDLLKECFGDFTEEQMNAHYQKGIVPALCK